MTIPDIDSVLALIIERQASKSSTILVGVTGGVAVGKSTFSRRIAQMLTEDTGLEVCVVSSDGFLHSNATLARLGLSDRKGFPESFDADAVIDFLAEINAGRSSSVPIYDHLIYDIVDGSLEVQPVDVLIFEGVNALQFHEHLDLCLFLHADEPVMREWFLQRTIGLREAAREDYSPFFDPWLDVPEELFLEMVTIAWETVNRPNLTEAIEPTRPLAHAVIEWNADHSIRAIVFQESP